MIEMIYHLLPGELQLGLDGKDGNICSECDLHHHNYFMKISVYEDREALIATSVKFIYESFYREKNNHTSIPT